MFRAHDWLKKVYFDVIKKYGKAMANWKLGTGGGSGAPENYCDWNTRQEEEFANYGGAPGSRVDHLAYIYMLDKKIGYAFNNINDPAPDSTVMEDGENTAARTDVVKSSKRKTKALIGAEKIGSDLASSMKSSMELLAKTMDNQTAAFVAAGEQHGTYHKDRERVAGKQECVDLMNDLGKMIHQLHQAPSSVENDERIRDLQGEWDGERRNLKRFKSQE